MKNTLLISLMLVGGAGAISAEVLSPEQALNRLDRSDVRKAIRMNQSSVPKLKATLNNLYIFSSGNGFMILPNNDQSPEILGYSDTEDFSTEGNPSFQAWLNFYNRELDYLKSAGSSSDSEGIAKLSSPRAQRQEIEPLIKTLWNQEWPYNIDCPKVDGHETVTGCVATAMAQGMKYYNFPERGKGKHSYYWGRDKDTLSFDYDNHPFKWDLMKDTYDRETPYENRQAVAELMYACGVSVDMYYGPGDSGAATAVMGAQLIDIFGYSPAMSLPSRDNYGLYEWEEMIYSDLAKGQPVLYSGDGTAGGHQFICDGYSTDGFFHINWGWGGLSNGYFLLTALNPGSLGVGGGAGGFNSGQSALLGFHPAQVGDKRVYIVTNGEAFRADVTEVRADEDFRCTGSYFNFSLYKLPDDTRLGMKFTPEDGGTPVFALGPGMGGFNPYDGRYDDQVKFPDLADGTYIITPALHVDGEWVEVRGPVGISNSVTAIVTDKVAKITDNSSAFVEVIDVTIPETVYLDHSFPMEFKVSNTSELEYFSDVTPYLLDTEGKEIAKSIFVPVDVMPGDTYKVEDYVARFTALKDETLTDGTYNLVFKDKANKTISSPLAVTLSTAPDKNVVKFTDFKIVTADPVTDPADVVFSVKVVCEKGEYYGAPHIDFFHSWGGGDIFSANAETIYITTGQEKETEVHADLSRLADGDYMCTMYDGGRDVTDIIHFTINRVSTGMESLKEKATDTDYYDMNGIKHEGELSPGLYIHEGKKIIITE